MLIRPPRSSATEHVISAMSGWPMLIVNFLLFAAAFYVLGPGTAPASALKLLGVALAILGLLMLGGYFTLQPNQARVLILFGAYKGTVREQRVSLGQSLLLAHPRQRFAKGRRRRRRRRTQPASALSAKAARELRSCRPSCRCAPTTSAATP